MRQQRQNLRLRRPINARQDQMNAVAFAPTEAFLDDRIFPHMLSAKTLDSGKIPAHGHLLDLCEKFDPNRPVGLDVGLQVIEILRRFWQDRIHLLMIESWEQPEPIVIDLEFSCILEDAPFPQDDRLLAPSQGFHNNRPFFEGDVAGGLHGQNISSLLLAGNLGQFPLL